MSTHLFSSIRALRSTVVPRNAHVVCGVNHGITLSAKKAISVQTTRSTVSSKSLIPSVQHPCLSDRKYKPNPFPDTTRHMDPLQNPQRYRFKVIESDTTLFHKLLNSITQTLTVARKSPLPILHSLLQTYISNPSDWSAFAHADPAKQYTRNLVCEVPGVFNLLLLVWTPGKASSIHDHANAHCLMKVCYLPIMLPYLSHLTSS